MKVLMEVNITDKRIVDLLCCGLEGGIIYWVEKIKVKNEISWKDLYNIKKDNWGIVIKDIDEKEHEINYQDLKKGMQKMADKASYHFSNFLNENEDALTGDVFVQLCCFDEITYG